MGEANSSTSTNPSRSRAAGPRTPSSCSTHYPLTSAPNGRGLDAARWEPSVCMRTPTRWSTAPATWSCHYGASCFYADSHVSMCSPCGEESPVSPLEPQEMGSTMWEQYTDRSNMHHQSPGLITFGDFIPTSSEWDQPCWHQPNEHQINSHMISAPHVQYMTMQQPAY